jgi:UDP-N-acetylglucosamine 2-epimerase (non-hydrolysing)
MTEPKRLKVATIVGTRPELIRLSRTIALLDENVDHILVHTGQNYDYELNEIFFQDLGIRKPDHYLEVDVSSLGKVLGETISKSEEVFRKENPDAVLILGDTNSSLAGIMAKRMKIPVYHMEAGNRCFDLNVPEEINRQIIDHISDFNLVYTENARRHLLSEGLSHRRIYLSGSPMYEVLMHYEKQIRQSKILGELALDKNGYFVVSIHREENVDNTDNLRSILGILNSICRHWELPVIVSTHPRTADRLEKLEVTKTDERIRFLKPFGFFDYVHLQTMAKCAISDSGTISEESSILSFPAITMRRSMERPEAIDAGTIILTGFDQETVLSSIDLVIREHEGGSYPHIPDEYQIKNTSMRVLKLIMGTTKLSNSWHGILPNV